MMLTFGWGGEVNTMSEFVRDKKDSKLNQEAECQLIEKNNQLHEVATRGGNVSTMPVSDVLKAEQRDNVEKFTKSYGKGRKKVEIDPRYGAQF